MDSPTKSSVYKSWSIILKMILCWWFDKGYSTLNMNFSFHTGFMPWPAQHTIEECVQPKRLRKKKVNCPKGDSNIDLVTPEHTNGDTTPLFLVFVLYQNIRVHFTYQHR